MGAAPDGSTLVNGVLTECGTVTDVDCIPGLSDGAGPGLVINANLIMGNAADSGSGGGLRFQAINGADVPRFPSTPKNWYGITVTNNIISNNVAGWDGAGVSLEDALNVNLINNTIVSNDTTASAGVLFNTLGAPLASTQSPPPTTTNNGTTSLPQPAGLVSMQNSPQLTSSFAGLTISCPANHPHCTKFSYPYLANDVFWQNRAFYIGVGALSATYQQNIVSLYNAFSGTPAATQPSADASTPNGGGTMITGGTGACTPGASYWDIGVRGDTGPTDHSSGITLAPTYSVLTNITGYTGVGNLGSNPDLVSQYCNGARTPPEFKSGGYNVPPGISDATIPNPIFSLTPNATVDEGNNWINISWGPLALTNPTNGVTLANYALAAGSPAINSIPTNSPTGVAAGVAPNKDFFGNTRPSGPAIDVGAIEFQQLAAPIATVGVGPLAFGNVAVNTTSASRTLTLGNTGNGSLTGINVAVTSPFSRTGGTCGATLAAGTTCSIIVVFSPTVTGPATGTATITGNVAVTGSPVSLTGTGIADVVSATLTPTSWSISQTRNCPGTGVGILACAADPSHTFTLTNTGSVTLTGITQGALGGTNASEFSVVRLLSTCGPAGNGQLTGVTTLAPGATCTVTVQFKPLTTQPAGVKSATISVTDAAGTQTSNLSGTAN